MKPEEVGKILADAGYASMEAIALLVLMLEERGVLEHGAYRGKLVSLLNDPDAIHERIDRSALHALVELLEKEERIEPELPSAGD
jgi:hypothetical protein